MSLGDGIELDQVIETLAYIASGGCCFLDRKERILFSGDACNGTALQTVLIHYWELWIKSSPMKVNLTAILMAGYVECLSVPWIIAS